MVPISFSLSIRLPHGQSTKIHHTSHPLESSFLSQPPFESALLNKPKNKIKIAQKKPPLSPFSSQTLPSLKLLNPQKLFPITTVPKQKTQTQTQTTQKQKTVYINFSMHAYKKELTVNPREIMTVMKKGKKKETR